MIGIKEFIIEPDKVRVGESFKIKIKIQNRERLITEDGKSLITEVAKILCAEEEE